MMSGLPRFQPSDVLISMHLIDLHVTTCSSGESASFCLNSKSPIARDKAKLPIDMSKSLVSHEHCLYPTVISSVPLTRPNSTKPPALMILSISASSVGLWSYDNGFTLPLILITPRESPALAYDHRSISQDRDEHKRGYLRQRCDYRP